MATFGPGNASGIILIILISRRGLVATVATQHRAKRISNRDFAPFLRRGCDDMICDWRFVIVIVLLLAYSGTANPNQRRSGNNAIAMQTAKTKPGVAATRYLKSAATAKVLY